MKLITRTVEFAPYVSAVLKVMHRRQGRRLSDALKASLADPAFDLDFRPAFTTERLKRYNVRFEGAAGFAVELAYDALVHERRVMVTSIQLEAEPDGTFHRRVASAYNYLLAELMVAERIRGAHVVAPSAGLSAALARAGFAAPARLTAPRSFALAPGSLAYSVTRPRTPIFTAKYDQTRFKAGREQDSNLLGPLLADAAHAADAALEFA